MVSFVFLYYTYQNFNFSDLASSISKVKFLYLILYFFLFIPLILILSKKYIILINDYKKIKFYDSIRINLISSFYNIFIPAKLGDLSRIYHSKIKKKYFLECSTLTIFEKIISFLSLILIVTYFKYQINFLSLFLILLIFIIFLKKFLNKKNKIYKNTKKKYIFFSNKVISTLKKNLLNFFLIDTVVWFIIFTQIFFIVKGSNLDIDFSLICYIFGLSILLGLIPVSFGGFGVRDVIIYNLLDNYISNQDILLLLIFFNLRYFIPAIFGFIFNTSGLYDKKRIY